MQNIEYKNSFKNKHSRIYTKRHHEIIDALEKLLEEGVPSLTMSEIAKELKISLRTLYEIAPSRDELILMTMDNILRKLGKFAMDSVAEVNSPIEKLEQYLFIVNQAVGQKFDRFLKDMEKINGSKKTADYHERFIKNFIENLLVEAIKKKEIKVIDVKAFSILLGGIGREFFKKENKKSISLTPEESANSITSIVLNGIKLEN
ncbi:MAG: TetR/AcrR family transcriptional regulator [SAR86 cluster bacterium]|mgnify:CR=1 FL=1|uniref:TetR/AcrR family transcriptional regulator n=1 Tax=SAR86 cluster bacterium TaxID=2030880 RepID=A0A368BK52_9GAMM|nr:TetR family transcriptional regulator [Gammaproteobacteria bacterium]RCL37252.1 MAG: TetR/AcrR family transcriptional regulator [SAR86 cluster bacterium]|tara:strand:- start:238 stop:849 length:612 start_codon:yes stop_codon:yes gene_type:complete